MVLAMVASPRYLPQSCTTRAIQPYFAVNYSCRRLEIDVNGSVTDGEFSKTNVCKKSTEAYPQKRFRAGTRRAVRSNDRFRGGSGCSERVALKDWFGRLLLFWHRPTSDSDQP